MRYKGRPGIEIVGGIEIVRVEWRSGRDTVGFVAVANKSTGNWHAFVGVAQSSSSEESDAIYIANWGAGLTKEEAMPFFSGLDESKYTSRDLY